MGRISATQKARFDPQRLAEVLDRLRRARNESYREASLRAGLDAGAVRRYIVLHQRPAPEALFALADHFEVNPNDLLELAGYHRIPQLDRPPREALPADVRPLVEDLARIADPALRQQLIRAIRVLLAGFL
jgi:hypothetical protein